MARSRVVELACLVVGEPSGTVVGRIREDTVVFAGGGRGRRISGVGLPSAARGGWSHSACSTSIAGVCLWGGPFLRAPAPVEPLAAVRCNPVVTRVLGLVAALAVALVVATPAQAAAPNYILVSGRGLAQPVLLADWSENGDLLVAVGSAPRATRGVVRHLRGRPRFDVAEFWGWGDIAPPTRPSQANQHGWFYPSWRGKPAVFVLMVDGVRAPRVARAEALMILARHGVPTRL